MNDYFKTIDEQIKILEGRGLAIEDRQKATNILLRYNYYKIVNATLPFFTEKDSNGAFRYRQGTDFKDLVEVAHFEKELKKILLTHMLEIERIARSIISYKFVEKHPEKNAYLNVDNYSKYSRNLALTNIDSIKETLTRYQEEENYNRSINYYMRKYDSVPFWFIINFISFGKVVNIFETLENELKEDIGDEFQKFVEENLGRKLDEYITPSMLESFLKNAKDIRNIAAHDNLILNYKFDDLEYFKTIHGKYGINEDDKRNRLFDTVEVLEALIPSSTFYNFSNDIESLFNILKDQVDDHAYKKIVEVLGYRGVK